MDPANRRPLRSTPRSHQPTDNGCMPSQSSEDSRRSFPYTTTARDVEADRQQEETFNIVPLHNMLMDENTVRFPEVRAAHAALHVVAELATPQGWRQGMDLLDWLALLFGFQADNVKNQREHITMLLANDQMRMQPPPDPIDRMDAKVVRKIRKKVLKNYVSWCAFLGKPDNLWLPKNNEVHEQRELLYASLYLLIWGEAANLRFMPECLCFLFHNMAGEMNKVLEHYLNGPVGAFMPTYTGENAFLLRVVTPLYNIVRAEAQASHHGTRPHSTWRNYDDMNEFFWSHRCFTQLSWPMNLTCSFMAAPGVKNQRHKVAKTGFVEQRSFWNIFRSFDHLWTGHILLLQTIIIMAFHDTKKTPWALLHERDVQARSLSMVITWAVLRVLQSVLDMCMQFGLISVDTMLIGIRMLLKAIVAFAWTMAFAILYASMWKERRNAGRWSGDANRAFGRLLVAAAIFILPEALGLILFIVPWLRNIIEQSNSKISRGLTWWFQSRWFVGRGLHEGLWDNIKYTLFWLLVLVAKFSFSYFWQIRPLVEPTRLLLALEDVEYSWHEFWGTESNRVAVLVLWAPVILIYFMDMQIWYTVSSSVVGALVGLLDHIGEIRNVEQVKLRFPYLPSAIALNLTSEESLLPIKSWYSWLSKITKTIRRVKIRYSHAEEFQKCGKGSIEYERFSVLWNSIITTFREEDIVSDWEMQLLGIPNPVWNISVTQWPCVLLSNELYLASEQVGKWEGSDDKRLWHKICRFEYRRSAIVECFESVRHVLLRIIRAGTQEHGWVERNLSSIEHACQTGTFLRKYNVKKIPKIRRLLLELVTILLNEKSKEVDEERLGTDEQLKKLEGKLQKNWKQKETFSELVKALQNLYEAVNRDLMRLENPLAIFQFGLMEDLPSAKVLPFTRDVIELPDQHDKPFYHQLRRLKTILRTQKKLYSVPQNLEAQRRIAFFCNSLFMNMPHAPPVERMLGFSVLTPYYKEDVVYSEESLRDETEDGISVLFYLQKIFKDEWENFMERMRREQGVEKEDELWASNKPLLALRLWASYRGQTLARTVRGMMYYEKALKVLAFLDGASQMEIQERRELLAAFSARGQYRPGSCEAAATASSSQPWVFNCSRSDYSGIVKEAQQQAVASMKFTYVVACQVYGDQKVGTDSKAADILFLMKTYKSLRVAYYDQVSDGDSKHENLHYSVLVKYDPTLEREVEVYRVQLPGPLILGEGKPENQNHALIFTRGDALQTIDMNQDNYFEEALKSRNLLQEFTVHHGLRRPQILGVREHVFTGSVSSLASFMSVQETSFVTLGQRVLAKPLKVRMHYGHPDVFDRLWFATRGGISKASKAINVSEDIYAGFNCTLRGGNVTHHEYIQAGKGRDVSLNQIAVFEAKVAGGNGEQILSRDVYRLSHRLDFFRMLSFYYTTVGFFISNLMVVLTVYAFLWGRVYLALSGLENSITSQTAFANHALTVSLNQQFIVQLGIFTALPMIVESTLEHGFRSAVWEFLTIQMQLASVFFTFSLGTRAHYFGRTVLHGGAGYRATGRGFVVQHEKFIKMYMLFARSHFVKGVELIILLIIYQSFGAAAAASTTVYKLIMFSSWFLALSWVLGPFLFNPLAFDSLKISNDFEEFWDWMWTEKAIGTGPDQSWEGWWEKEYEHLKNTGFWAVVSEIVLDLRFLFLQYGVVYQLGIVGNSKSILVYLISWAYMAMVAVVYMILFWAAQRFSVKKHIYLRLVQALVAILVVGVLIVLVLKTSFELWDALLSLLAFMPTGWSLLSIALVFSRYLERTAVWPFIITMARLYELSFGILLFIPIVALSWIPGFQDTQTRILFNQAFSRGLQITRLLCVKKPYHSEEVDKEEVNGMEAQNSKEETGKEVENSKQDKEVHNTKTKKKKEREKRRDEEGRLCWLEDIDCPSKCEFCIAKQD